MYKMIDKSKSSPALSDMEQMYKELVENHGAEITSLKKISRNELDTPYLLKNADFSKNTIMELIRQGEENALQQIKSGFAESKQV